MADYLLVPAGEPGARGLLVDYYDEEHRARADSCPPTQSVEGVALIDGDAYRQTADGQFIPAEHYDEVAERRRHGADAGHRRRRLSSCTSSDTFLQRRIVVPVFLCVFLLGLYLLGKFLAAGMGRFFWLQFERVITRLPLVRNVYSSVKQVTDFVFSETGDRVHARRGGRVSAQGNLAARVRHRREPARHRLPRPTSRADGVLPVLADAVHRLHGHGEAERNDRPEHHDGAGVTIHGELRRRVAAAAMAYKATCAPRSVAAASPALPAAAAAGKRWMPHADSSRFRIGTRGSKLARWQSDWVAARTDATRASQVEIVEIATRGDVQQHGPVAAHRRAGGVHQRDPSGASSAGESTWPSTA